MMTKRQYESTVRKMSAAYKALETAAETARYFERMRIADAMDALVRAAEELRIQRCKRCKGTGHHGDPNDPYVSISCSHTGIARVDLRYPR